MNIKDRQFREYAEKEKYPFTQSSTYMASNGRPLPLSVFVDILLYPSVYPASKVYVSRVGNGGDAVVIELTDGVTTWKGKLLSDPGGCFLYAPSGSVEGVIVLNTIGEEYLKGVAKSTALSFPPQALSVRPDRIIPRPTKGLHVEVEGVEVIRKDIPLTAAFGSTRYTLAEGEVSLDNNIGAASDRPIITSLNGVLVNNRSVYVKTAKGMNLQIVSDSGAIVFHKRGDKR